MLKGQEGKGVSLDSIFQSLQPLTNQLFLKLLAYLGHIVRLSLVGISFIDAGVYVVTSPKVLSTSLKLCAFEVENGREFVPFKVRGRVNHIHNFFPAKGFEKVDRSKYPVVVCFFRDPLERFVSMYANRVLRKNQKSAHHWEAAENRGVDPFPSLEFFAKNLDLYRRELREIEHHSKEQVYFLGRRPDHYDHIFSPDLVNEFEEMLSSRLGRPVILPHAQKSAGANELAVSEEVRSVVRKRYRADYRFGAKAQLINLK